MLGASFHDERTSDGDKVSKFLTQLVAGPSQSVGFCESTKQESVAAACLPILRTEQRVRASCQELKFITSNFFKTRDAGTMRLLSQNSDENVKPTKNILSPTYYVMHVHCPIPCIFIQNPDIDWILCEYFFSLIDLQMCI